MATRAEILSRLRDSMDLVNRQLERVTEEQMTESVTWHEAQFNVRFMFYRILAHEVEHTVHLIKTLGALGVAQSEAQVILSKIQASQGELEGLVVGLSDEDLDRSPGEGEWSPRQVLEHVIDVQGRYTQRVVEALENK